METRRYRSWLPVERTSFDHILREYRYDLLIDFTADPLSAVLCNSNTAPPSLGFDRPIRFLSGHIDIGPAYDLAIPFSETEHLRGLMLRLVSPWTGEGTPFTAPRIVISESAEEEGANLLASKGVDSRPFVVLHPGANWPPKRWPPSHWVSLAKIVQKSVDHALMVMGAASDESLVTSIIRGSPRAVPIIGMGLDITAAIIKRSSLCVCNDSAAMHIAAAVGTPSVSLFGPVSPARSAPFPEEGCEVLYQEMFCSPCTLYYSRDRCRRGLNFCMQAIDPEVVFESMVRSLQTRGLS
ncbi:MAG: glycosyltransferase family 9 protein [Thermodesulfobacteriota bacterium]